MYGLSSVSGEGTELHKALDRVAEKCPGPPPAVLMFKDKVCVGGCMSWFDRFNDNKLPTTAKVGTEWGRCNC